MAILHASQLPVWPESGVKITGYELVRETVEAPLRDGKVPRQKIDPKVADNLERWMESEGQLLGEEVIRVMTKTKKMGAPWESGVPRRP